MSVCCIGHTDPASLFLDRQYHASRRIDATDGRHNRPVTVRQRCRNLDRHLVESRESSLGTFRTAPELYRQ